MTVAVEQFGKYNLVRKLGEGTMAELPQPGVEADGDGVMDVAGHAPGQPEIEHPGTEREALPKWATVETSGTSATQTFAWHFG